MYFLIQEFTFLVKLSSLNHLILLSIKYNKGDYEFATHYLEIVIKLSCTSMLLEKRDNILPFSK